MAAPAVHAASVPNAKPGSAKRSKRDYTLPHDFIALLSRHVQAVIDELIPPSSSAGDPSTPAFSDSTATATDATHPFPEAFRKNADAQTEKGGNAFKSTQSALVDLFFDFAPPTDPKHLQKLLDAAWQEDPVLTTRLIFQTRSIHEGKGYKEGWWMAAGWLWEKHPRTFLNNLHILVDPTCKRERSYARDAARGTDSTSAAPLHVETLDEEGEVEPLAQLAEYPARPHGTYDDLIDLLVLHINGQLNASITEVPDAVDEGIVKSRFGAIFKEDRMTRKSRTGVGRRDRVGFKVVGKAAKQNPAAFTSKLAKCGTKETKHMLLAERLETSLTTDGRFRALYCTVVDLFLQQLRADLASLDEHREFLKRPQDARKPFLGNSSPHLFGISYAGKWAPTPGKSADRQLHMASALATMLFPGEGFAFARERLQREVLAPLRAVLQVPETKMGQDSWHIDYTKVPSRCMTRNAQNFYLHDPQGFEAYLDRVARGKATISGASLMPHEILMDAVGDRSPVIVKVAELQWRTLVDSLRGSATLLQGSLAIADVSGSMGTFMAGNKKRPHPATVCISLTLLLGEIAAAPWNGMFFTFSSEPTAEFIDPAQPLATRVASLSQAHWEMSTNIEKVFALILGTATREKLAPADMVKRLFIFSDMQFDQCIERQSGDSEYAAIRRKFTAAGYTLPEVIFWNLAPRVAGAPKPVRADQEGVSLLSGYSGAMMKYFLGRQEDEDEVENEDMAEAIGNDWQAVDGSDIQAADRDETTGQDGAATNNTLKSKAEKRADPLKTVKNILNAESFSGVKVVD